MLDRERRLMNQVRLFKWPIAPLLISSTLLTGALLLSSTGQLMASGPASAPTDRTQQPDLSKLPTSFEPNVGQTDSVVRFLAHAPGGTLFFTPEEVVLLLRAPNEANTSAN